MSLQTMTNGQRWLHYTGGVVSLAMWLALFGTGITLSSEASREALNANFSFTRFINVCIQFTYTNVAMLVCVSGFLGGICSRLSLEHDDYTRNAGQLLPANLQYRIESPFTSMFRGFLVFLVYLAGVTIGISIGAPGAQGGAFMGTTTPDQYMRLAGLLSVVAFVVGFDPSVFRDVLNSVRRTLNKNSDPPQPPGPPAGNAGMDVARYPMGRKGG